LRRLVSFVLVFVLVAVVGARLTSSADEAFRVIINPGVKGTQIRRAAVSSIFLREATGWGDGSPASPVDQSMRSPVRQAFSMRVLGKPIEGVQAYWNRCLSSGIWPPPVKSSDADVISFVASTPGAIGYVSSSTALPDSVKELTILD
jgi:ABC-type phosphate transport system substrate-binding protein